MRRVLVWITPTGWEACVDASRDLGDVTLLQVSDVGPPEHAVVEAAAEFDLLVLSRSNRDPGPHSIGHAARFVVDHATCPILVVWP